MREKNSVRRFWIVILFLVGNFFAVDAMGQFALSPPIPNIFSPRHEISVRPAGYFEPSPRDRHAIKKLDVLLQAHRAISISA